MAIDIETPSEVMYVCLKQFGGIKNNDLARMLFSETFKYGGSLIVERLGERTLLSRVITRAAPGDFPETAFRPLPDCAQSIYSQIAPKYPGIAGKQQIIGYFTGEACDRMADCLAALGLNDILYRNMARRLNQMESVSLGDKSLLLILLFVATGCIGNPSRAAKITQDYARRIASSTFATTVVGSAELSADAVGNAHVKFGLCRLVDGKLRMPAYPLDTGENGTEIGSLSTAEGAINDVGPGVSRRHVRVFRDRGGEWFAQGLGSTNGTVVLHAESGEEEPVELPRMQRTPGQEAPCVQIFANDTLRLAASTEFVVLEMA